LNPKQLKIFEDLLTSFERLKILGLT